MRDKRNSAFRCSRLVLALFLLAALFLSALFWSPVPRLILRGLLRRLLGRWQLQAHAFLC